MDRTKKDFKNTVIFILVLVIGVCLLSRVVRFARKIVMETKGVEQRTSEPQKVTTETQQTDFKPGSEPDGFRGIKWGTDVSTLSGMQYCRKDPIYGEMVHEYIRENDDLSPIGGANIKGIVYKFWGGKGLGGQYWLIGDKFCGVVVYTKGYTNWTGLKEATFEKFGTNYRLIGKFGKDYQPVGIKSYIWIGDITCIELKYDDINETGILFVQSTEIANKLEAWQEAWRKKKAKEGAEKGF